MPSGKKDGRIVADIGENLKRQFKSALSLNGQTMTDWLKERIGKFVKTNGKCKDNKESEV